MTNTEFTFLVINTKARWEEGSTENLEVLDDGIALEKETTYTLRQEITEAERWEGAADIAIDACGILYILDGDECRILTYDPSNKQTEYLRGIGGQGTLPGQFKCPGAIAICPDTLYVADTENNRIQAFARTNLQIRWIAETADFTEFKPAKIVPDGAGGLYVLDKGGCRILKFDQGGRLLVEFGGEVLQGKDPANIAVDTNGFLYVLGTKKIFKFGIGGEYNLVEPPEFNLEKLSEPSGLAVDPDGNVYVGDKKDGGFIHKFKPDGDYVGPLLGYQGSCHDIVMDNQGNFYIIRGNKGGIAFLKYIIERYSIKEPGTFISGAFDSNEHGCRWHKLILDALIPDKTQIDVYHYISDEEELLETKWSKLATFRSSDVNLRDALIRGPAGRYLWLKLELTSTDEYKTPKIDSVETYFPRISYLRYLPAVYQEDAISSDFLERYLSLFETFLGDNDAVIGGVHRYFDSEATPGEFLSWLAIWVAAVFDESWQEDKKRKFLQSAVELYKKRGTKEGLEELIEIYTGDAPMIVENLQLYKKDVDGNFVLRCEESDELKAVFEKLFGDPAPFNFCVLLKPNQNDIESQLKAVKRIIALEKPVHTSAEVTVLQPWIYLDLHTYLGVNTYLSKPVMQLGITSVIGRDTVLSDTEESGQIERRSKTGIDTKLT
ncbi:MAG: phage tail protein [Euryarchaeota archaeon]|nr:phage tail protein [Euryarchaeota archaeon]